uniref:IF rod domain-containing protein n=1 Tax=Tetraodon nigroviridis TaxID=99883 RepID=H3D624_TETNG
MAHHGARKPFHLGEEKHQMLNLNHRLETYLNRVKLLEEENLLLAKEIQVLRCSSQHEVSQRKSLEKNLQQARQEVDSAWRERAHMELEVGRLMQELQDLDTQRQREAQAQAEANKMLELSRKELEEEQRAQVWLSKTAAQLQQEMRHLIQTHQEDVAHLEATLNQSRATRPPTVAPRAEQRANVLQLGQEYSQQTTRAWQEAAQAYQGQLAHLEASVNQARSHLMQVGQEKRESQLKLQVLEKEITTAQDLKMHLEKTAAQQGQNYSQQIQELQEHLVDLEEEKAELGRQINYLQLEKRDLLHVKTSLSLEVATYRALLDGEGLRGGATLVNLPGNISVPDAAFSPGGVQTGFRSRLPVGHKTTVLSSVHTHSPTASVGSSRKPAAVTEAPKVPVGAPEPTEGRAQPGHQEASVSELLPPQQEVEVGADGGEEAEETVEQVVGSQVGSGLGSEAPPSREESQPGSARPTPTPYHQAALLGKPAEETQEPRVPEGKAEEEGGGGEQVQQESSDSETEALIEPNFESRTSSPLSEYEPEEGVFPTATAAWQRAEPAEEGGSLAEKLQAAGDDRLYPDGEEMDTYDSAMERKTGVKTKEEEETRQHAEPEEDISAKEQRPEQTERRRDPIPRRAAIHSGADEEEEEDSQNVSVSWRTELESDSYAQDNTLADPRPLIRYRSEEADGASPGDESQSSEEEQEEAEETGRWSEDQAPRFGTMEDLCEEAEEEGLDEEYDLGYRHADDRSPGQEAEPDLLLDGAQEVTREAGQRPSEDGTEEHLRPAGPAEVDHEEAETEGFVEQKVEEMGRRFSQQQLSETENLGHLHHSDPTQEQPANSRGFTEPTVADAEVQPEEQEPSGGGEEQEERVSMVTHAGPSTRPDPEEVSCSEEPDGLQPGAAEATLEDEGVSAQEERSPAESVAASQDAPAAGWRNLGEDGGEQKQDPESAGSPVQDQQQRLSICPEAVEDIFVVRTSAKTNGSHSSLQDFLSGVKNDFWASSLETGATNQPEGGCGQTAEQSPQGLGFDAALMWGGLGIDPPAGLKTQETSEGKQLLVHSEESEVEAESWSSGEEPV